MLLPGVVVLSGTAGKPTKTSPRTSNFARGVNVPMPAAPLPETTKAAPPDEFMPTMRLLELGASVVNSRAFRQPCPIGAPNPIVAALQAAPPPTTLVL